MVLIPVACSIADINFFSASTPPDIDVPVHCSTITAHFESARSSAASTMRGVSCSSGARWRFVMPTRVKCARTSAGRYFCACSSTMRLEEGMMKPMRARGTIGV